MGTEENSSTQNNGDGNNEIPMNEINSKEIEPINTNEGAENKNDTVEIVEESSKKDEGKSKDQVPQEVTFFEMFRFATKLDILLMIIGTIGAIGNGAGMPAISIAFGRLLNVFSPENFKDPNYDLVHEVTMNALIFVYIGAGVFICSYFEVAFWMLAGERQTIKCRKEYFKAIIRQEIGWFDITKPSELSTRISSDTELFQNAIGEKVGNFIHHTSTFIAGFVVGFVYGWQLTLVIVALTPLTAAAGGFVSKVLIGLTIQGQMAYAKAGAIAEEKIGSIRTVSTFSGEQFEIDRYTEKLKEALKLGYKKGLMNGLGMGFVYVILFGIYSIAFWYGGKLIVDKHWNPLPGRDWNGGDVLTVVFSVIMGSMALGQASPNISAFASGRGSAYKIYEVIDRKSSIDPFSTEGQQLVDVKGDIEFRNISFSYPSRPDVEIFNGFNLSIKQGQTVALCGPSGGGKSSVIGLLERFYDPLEGEILLDGINIKDININSLRTNIGLVLQEPTLFATTIAENIRYGNENATTDQIIEACKAANAHDFISALSEGYDTQVGEKGVQMSGGQKQRIAIARAMIKNPKILLLDEATSALDTENEHLVQQAIDKLMKGRTTIVIAHRLSTIVNSDLIVVINKGKIIEQGNHESLLKLEGAYNELIQKQQKVDNKSKNKIKNQLMENVNGNGNYIKMDDDADDDDSDGSGNNDDQEIIELPTTSNNINNGNDKSLTIKNDQKIEQVNKKHKSVPISRILKLSKSDWPYFIIGFIGAAVNGSAMPVFSLIFGEILKIFQLTDMDELTRRSRDMALWFLLLAFGSGIANFMQIYSFNVIGEKLTFNLRRLSFNSILRQDIGWFDLQENSTGRLTTNLSIEATMVQSLASQRMSLLLQNAITVIAGLLISFISGWKLTLVVLAFVPLIIFTGKVNVTFLQGFSKKNKESYANCGQVATEAIGGIRTILSFTCESKVLDKFSQCLIKPMKLCYKNSNIGGFSYGFSQATLFFIYTLTYWYGGKLINQYEWRAPQSTIDAACTVTGTSNGPYDGFGDYSNCERVYNTIDGYGNMMKVFFAVIMSAMAVGNSMAFLPDVAKAKLAAIAIFDLLDRESLIDPLSNKGQKPNEIIGNIEFKDISFKYPSRPNKVIFDKFSLSIKQGQKVALCGASGGGKSTCISLLERFYNPLEGTITLDGIDIKDLNLNWLRNNLAFVNQEPTLFSGTVFENIIYGKKDATMEEVVEAAKSANAHSFIETLPDGYYTQLGDKFTQLSGGQKQRVAIARAIIRNPKILLLDEATSALDSVSEKLVQEALDNVMKGRTTIVIAHRLSTIMDSDLICVVKDGRVYEQGSHQELLLKNGFYKQLISKQQNL